MKRSTLIVIMIGFILVLLPSLTNGQVPNTWSPPQVLGDGWWESIAVDQHGNTYVGWYGLAGDNMDALMYASRTLDGTWTPHNDVIVAGYGGLTVRNSLVATSDGMLHAVFRSGGSQQFSSAYTSMAGVAASWSAPVEINDAGYYVDMTADEHDVLHIVYSGSVSDLERDQPVSLENDPCPYCSDLYYRRSADGGQTWSFPFNLTRDPDAGSDRPDIWIGSSGRMYVVWDKGFDWYVGRGQPQDVRIVYSDDAGLTWSDPIILDGGNLTDYKPIQIAAAELRDGSLMAVWRYSDDRDQAIYYQVSADLGQTWTAPAPIPGIVARRMNDTPLDDYELIIDRLGSVHLFAVGQPDESSASNPTLFHLEYRQSVWRSKQIVYYSPEDWPEWPKAVIGLQNDIHLTWFVRGIPEGATEISYTDRLQVYYSHLPGALALEPTQAFNATRTPLPTPTVFQRLDPTLPPLPTVLPIESIAVRATQDTYAAQAIVGGSLVTAMVCLGILVVFRVRIRPR